MAGDELTVFLGSGVLTCVLSDNTFAGERGEEKKQTLAPHQPQGSFQ